MSEGDRATGTVAHHGYWEPHTSSIDFCESNYLHTPYVAEPHNVWSSLLGLCAVGILGLWGANPTKEWRFMIIHSVLVVVGLGSALLHGTLHWFYQSSDELPMLYLVASMLYAVAECESPWGRQTYPLLPAGMLLLVAANTAIYYTFQHLYAVFIATFLVGSTLSTVGLIRLVFYRDGRGPGAKRLFWQGELYYTAIGLPMWLFDMVLCHGAVLPVANSTAAWLLWGATPHVIWHFAAGLGAYCLTASLCCCRCEAIGVPYRVSYRFGGLVPWVTADVDVAALRHTSSCSGIDGKTKLG